MFSGLLQKKKKNGKLYGNSCWADAASEPRPGKRREALGTSPGPSCILRNFIAIVWLNMVNLSVKKSTCKRVHKAIKTSWYAPVTVVILMFWSFHSTRLKTMHLSACGCFYLPRKPLRHFLHFTEEFDVTLKLMFNKVLMQLRCSASSSNQKAWLFSKVCHINLHWLFSPAVINKARKQST